MIRFHKQDDDIERALMNSRTGGVDGNVLNKYELTSETLSSGGRSVMVNRARVLERTTLGGVSVDKPKPGSNYVEDYFTKDATKKLQIVLHFTAGTTVLGWLMRGDRPQGSGSGKNVGVAYAVSTTGKVFELYDDKYWGDSSSASGGKAGNFNQNVVAIEIANPGPLILASGKFCGVAAPNVEVCSQAEAHEVYELAKPYRGYKYYLKYTSAQYESLRDLLGYLCAKHDIPYEFLPDDRPEDPEESTRFKCRSWVEQTAFRGICSHVNYSGLTTNKQTGVSSWAKWDIGPAFEWNELRPKPRLYFPFPTKSDPPPPAVFASNETSRGGNFVVGEFHNIHGGIHLFPRASPNVVRSMAPGVIVAARLAPQGPTDQTVAFTNNYNGFVLVKHLVRNKADGKELPIYSLYMHLAYPKWSGDANEAYSTVPWAKRLLRAQHGVAVDARLGDSFGDLRWVKSIGSPTDSKCEVYKGETFNSEPFTLIEKVKVGDKDENRVRGVFKSPPEELATASKGLKDGKIITFHVPYFFLSGGEAVGYVAQPPEANSRLPTGFLHWEVFSPTKDSSLRKLLALETEVGKDMVDHHTIVDSGSDNYLGEADFKEMVEKASSPEEKGLLEPMLQARSYGAIFDRMRSSTAAIFARNTPAAPTPNEKMLAYGLDLVIRKSDLKVQSGNYHLSLEFLDDEGKQLPDPEAPFRVALDVSLSDQDLTKRITVPAGTVKIVVTSTDLHVYESETPGDRAHQFADSKKVLKDLLGYRFRNALVEHVTEWSQAGLESLYEKSEDLRKQFPDLKKLLPVTWWGRTSGDFGEVPLRDQGSIFGAADLPKDGKIDNIHPVTALWLLSLLQKYDKISFSNSPTEYAGHRNPELMYLGWAQKATGRVGLGDELGVLAIRKDFNSDERIAIKVTNGATELDLGQTPFKDGVAKVRLKAAFWGAWELKVPQANAAPPGTLFGRKQETNDQFDRLFGNPLGPVGLSIDAPALRGMTGPVAVPKTRTHELRLQFSANCPTEIAGVVYFHCYKIPKAKLDAGSHSGPWVIDSDVVLCPQALVVKGTVNAKFKKPLPPVVIDGECVVPFDSSTLVDDFARAVNAAEGDRVLVYAGFYGPNGGDYALANTRDYRLLDGKTVELQSSIKSRLRTMSPHDEGIGVGPDYKVPFLQFDNLGFSKFSYRMLADAVVATVSAGSLPSIWKDITLEGRCNDLVVAFDKNAVTVGTAKLTAMVATLKYSDLKKANAVGKGTQARFSLKIKEGSTLGYSVADQSDLVRIEPRLASFEIIDPTTVLPTDPRYSVVRELFAGLKKPTEHVCFLGKSEWVGTEFDLPVQCHVLKPPATVFEERPQLSAKISYSKTTSSGAGGCNDRGYFGAWISAKLIENLSTTQVKFVWGRPGKPRKKVWDEDLAPLETSVINGGKSW